MCCKIYPHRNPLHQLWFYVGFRRVFYNGMNVQHNHVSISYKPPSKKHMDLRVFVWVWTYRLVFRMVLSFFFTPFGYLSIMKISHISDTNKVCIFNNTFCSWYHSGLYIYIDIYKYHARTFMPRQNHRTIYNVQNDRYSIDPNQSISQHMQRSSHADIPTKYQYLTGTTIWDTHSQARSARLGS